MDGRMESAGMFCGSFEEGKVPMGVRRNAQVFQAVVWFVVSLNLIVGFSVRFHVPSMVQMFLDVDAIESGTMWMEVYEHFMWGAIDEAKKFAM